MLVALIRWVPEAVLCQITLVFAVLTLIFIEKLSKFRPQLPTQYPLPR
jgi:hypothetical protein